MAKLPSVANTLARVTSLQKAVTTAVQTSGHAIATVPAVSKTTAVVRKVGVANIAGVAVLGAVTYVAVKRGWKMRSTMSITDRQVAKREKHQPHLVRKRPTIGYAANAYFLPREDEAQWIRDMSAWIPKEPKTLLGKILVRIWASPMTAVGFLLGLTTFSRPVIRDGVFLFSNGFGPFRMLYTSKGTNAITFGHTVISKEWPDEVLMRHELAHTRQAERLSVGFGLIYTWCNWSLGYARNPLERAARRYAIGMPSSSLLPGASDRVKRKPGSMME